MAAKRVTSRSACSAWPHCFRQLHAQTYQFVATGNAELGFAALAQVVLNPERSHWLVPQTLYTPIRQDAVLLNSSTEQAAAREHLDYLKGPDARAIIQRYGYGID